jgi:DDE superfamily endonuclease
MTSDLSEEYVCEWLDSTSFSDYTNRWIKGLDIKMQLQSHKICLFIDNFSGHNIAYMPTNICLKWFEPNLILHIQPLDAGIICYFKALYHHAFYLRALELDNAGEANIYKINLLEAMMMAKEAWDNVTSMTIQACWDHTKIQQAPIMLCIPML